VKILLAQMLRLDRTAPRISSARKRGPFLSLSNGTSDILAVAPRLQVLGGLWTGRVSARPGWVGEKVPEPPHKSLAGHPPPQRMEEERSSTCPCLRMLMASLFIVGLSSGCALIMVGDPVQEQDISAQNDAEENLKAIRAMLADQAARRAQQLTHPRTEAPPPVTTSDGPPMPLEPSSQRPVPSPSSSTGPSDVPAKLPWTPTAPQRSAVPDRPVPAYTTPAPVGPDYSGSIRCTPDGMGGQRCLGR
jgi:hypothetical protein